MKNKIIKRREGRKNLLLRKKEKLKKK